MQLPLSSCTFQTCSLSSSPYGYRPGQVDNISFLLISAINLLGCLGIAVFTRRHIGFTVLLLSCPVLEVVGYSARVAGTTNPWNVPVYAVATTVLTMGPSLIPISMYGLMPRILGVVGTQYSLVDTRFYTRLTHFELFGIAVRLIGLGVTFSDASTTAGLGPNATKGGYVVAVGMGLHAIALSVFLVLLVALMIRASMADLDFGCAGLHAEKGGESLSARFRWLQAILLFAPGCLLLRAVYWVAALATGPGGTLVRNEEWFSVLDALPVVHAVIALALVHPAYSLRWRENVTLARRDGDRVSVGRTIREARQWVV